MESSCFLLLAYYKTTFERFLNPCTAAHLPSRHHPVRAKTATLPASSASYKRVPGGKSIKQEYPSKLISSVLAAIIQSEIHFFVSGTMEAHVDNVAH